MAYAPRRRSARSAYTSRSPRRVSRVAPRRRSGASRPRGGGTQTIRLVMQVAPQQAIATPGVAVGTEQKPGRAKF